MKRIVLGCAVGMATCLLGSDIPKEETVRYWPILNCTSTVKQKTPGEELREFKIMAKLPVNKPVQAAAMVLGRVPMWESGASQHANDAPTYFDQLAYTGYTLTMKWGAANEVIPESLVGQYEISGWMRIYQAITFNSGSLTGRLVQKIEMVDGSQKPTESEHLVRCRRP